MGHWFQTKTGSILGNVSEPVANSFEDAGHRLIDKADQKLTALLGTTVDNVDMRLENKLGQFDNIFRAESFK